MQPIGQDIGDRATDRAGGSPGPASPAGEPRLGREAPRPRAIGAALCALLLVALVYAAHVSVGLGRGGHEGVWNHWVYDGVIGTAGLLCLMRSRRGADRRAWGLIGVAISVYWLGDLYWNNYLSSLSNPPYPSWADAGWLTYYLPLYAGMMLLLRARMRGLTRSAWLEGIVGGLALASMAATAVFDPLVASTHGSVSTVLTNLAYPTLDVLLLALVAGGYAVLGRSAGRPWMLLGLGLLMAGGADSVYLFQAASGSYSEGGWVNAGWPLAFTLMACAAWMRSAPAPSAPSGDDASLHVLSAVFALLILGQLAYGTFEPVPAVAHVLVTLAVLTLFARVALATRERRQLTRTTIEARTDDLTGLANRRSLYDAIDRALENGEPLALVFVDLDRFLDLSDTLGREAGEDLLRQVSRRLADAEPECSLLARLGGDEFVLVIQASELEPAAMRAAGAIRAALEEPFALEGLLVTAHASIGVALAPQQAGTRADLLRCADVAMCRARSHHSGIEFYDDEGEDHGRHHLVLVSELRKAIDGEELVLHYQPKVSVADGRCVGVEALVRWQHPRHGLLGPDRFVSIVEREGMMRLLTLAVLDRALAQQREWRLANDRVPLAVNLSPSNLMDTRLPADVEELLRRHDTPPDQLELEITEETLMRDPKRGLDVIARIGELGVSFSLDDFGTGYSSLAQLRRLPVHALKIDRSFIMNMGESPEDESIVRSTIELGHSLSLKVIAEGVETGTDLQALARHGCDVAQGYYISRPVPADALCGWLHAGAVPVGAVAGRPSAG